eukprot:CAMPEP_0168730488 /NCGR_PEP_ID=MMETSP0724-20121128/6757_1 /TAXON_ID=265536 /ORGANISM="Amphiprora sp., Strain CCMP467" /LENGTH=196 /DNA_ID=CAMNT_0008777429 /DNA_START=31 /DNA_END=621 /DNA_ORIENTATION=+
MATTSNAAGGNYRRVPLSSSDSISSFSSQQQQQPLVQTQQLPNDTTTATPHSDDNSDDRHRWRNSSERFLDKLWAAAWVTMAVLVGYWARVPTVLFTTSALDVGHRRLLHVSAAVWGINAVLAAYLTVYLPKVRNIPPEAWNTYCPRVIPTMTGLGVVAVVLMIRATWPAWGFLSPAVLSLEGLGLLFALQFVPAW